MTRKLRRIFIFITIAGAAYTGWWASIPRPPEPQLASRITLHVNDTAGNPKQGLTVSATYPVSTENVTAKTDEKGIGVLSFKPHLLAAPLSIYISEGGKLVGQVVVALPNDPRDMHREAVIGSYLEYEADGAIKRQHHLQ